METKVTSAFCHIVLGILVKMEPGAYSSEKLAHQSTGMLPPKPVKAATPSERSDAGGLFLLYLVSCRQNLLAVF